jgi:hypothetical protein
MSAGDDLAGGSSCATIRGGCGTCDGEKPRTTCVRDDISGDDSEAGWSSEDLVEDSVVVEPDRSKDGDGSRLLQSWPGARQEDA